MGTVIAYCGAQTPLFCHKQLLVVHNLILSALEMRAYPCCLWEPIARQWLESVRNALGW